jgi:hypothetical protein
MAIGWVTPLPSFFCASLQSRWFRGGPLGVVEVWFFRNLFWGRLMVNIGIVLVFAAFYLRFFKRP